MPLLEQTHPAPLLQIFRDLVKPGNEAAYQEIERETARLMRGAAPLESEWALRFPNSYLAVEPLSGSFEVWFLTIWTSRADLEKVGESYRAAPASLAVALERNSKRRAALTISPVSVLAEYRERLSAGRAWVMGRERFLVITRTRADGPFDGSVYESEDHMLYILQPAGTREQAEQTALRNGKDSLALRVRPDLSRPAQEWAAADEGFWKGEATR
jgi:hypothetical protein